ncbi:MAG: hypothetical protein ACRDY0_07225 [Acidimicrobiales bacterium]
MLLVVAGAVGYLGWRPPAPVVGANVFVNQTGIIDAFSTPTVVGDPRRPSDLVAVYRKDRPQLSGQLSWSTDGGSAWKTTSLPLPDGLHEAFFPDAAFAPDGSLYVVYVDLEGRGNVPADLWLARSSDGGRTLSAPLRLAGANAFQPRILVSAGGAVYLTWLQVDAAAGGRLGGAPLDVVATSSTDGGATFAVPVAVSHAGDVVASPDPVLAADGHLVVAYQDSGPAPPAPGAPTTSPPPNPPSALVVSRARGAGPGLAGGFSNPVVVDPRVVSHQRSSLFDNLFPSVAAGSGGDLYLVWSGAAGRGEQVMLSRSTDGGRRWSAPSRVEGRADAVTGPARYLPSVSVAPDGRLDVAFLAQRADHFADVYLATSTDRGASFTLTRTSSASFDARVGPNFGNGLPSDLGSHLGLLSRGSGAEVAWTDSRLGTTTTGRQDIVAAGVDVASGSIWSRPLVDVAAGLAVVAAGLLVAAGAGRARGRRGGADPVPVPA